MALSTKTRKESTIATQKPKLTVYVEQDVYEALILEAEAEERSQSLMAAILIKEALIARGKVSRKVNTRRNDAT